MRVMRKILPVLVILALLLGGVLLGERLTTQELTRVAHPSTEETVCLIWQPKFLRNGVCSLQLRNSQDKIVDTAQLGSPGSGFEALQQFGQLGFAGDEITVANLRTGELLRRFVVRDGRLSTPE